MTASHPGSLVRAAREDVGMTQRALADAVGLRQSNVSAIEAGTRSVSSDMLGRLLSAADLRPSLLLAMHAAALREIARRLGIENVRVFGSVARGTDHHGSDVDLLVDLRSGVAGFELGAFRSEAEDLLGTSVDVVVDDPDDRAVDRMRATSVPL